jgi:hypothetical protein
LSPYQKFAFIAADRKEMKPTRSEFKENFDISVRNIQDSTSSLLSEVRPNVVSA